MKGYKLIQKINEYKNKVVRISTTSPLHVSCLGGCEPSSLKKRKPLGALKTKQRALGGSSQNITYYSYNEEKW